MAAFLSTLSLRRATCSDHVIYVLGGISIHALLAESDARISTSQTTSPDFYPRSPCGERPVSAILNIPCFQFLSTLSLRRATRPRPVSNRQSADFYPRSPCGERRSCISSKDTSLNFYPRPPCGERRRRNIPARKADNFYPRSPCGERLSCPCYVLTIIHISIHALLAESDTTPTLRPSCIVAFLSTLSLRRATRLFCDFRTLFGYFYPRSPCGERQWRQSVPPRK